MKIEDWIAISVLLFWIISYGIVAFVLLHFVLKYW
jgi:hypothetical protein